MNYRLDATLTAFITLLLLWFSATALAHDDDADNEEEATTEIPLDDFNRGTPERTATGFMSAVESGDFERAANYLDLRNLRGEATALEGAELARRLYVIVKRATWVDVDELVDVPEGRSKDGLPSYRDSVGLVLDEGREVRVLLQKVPRGDGVYIWKVSNATVSLIPDLYDLYGYPEIVEKLQRELPNLVFLGYELFKWVILIGVAVSAWLTVSLIAWLLRGNGESPGRNRLFSFLVVPFSLWLVLLLVHATATELGNSRMAEEWEAITPIPTLVTVWMLFVAANLVRDFYGDRLRSLDRPGAALMMQPAANAIKLLIIVGAVLFYLNKLGINITTVLAGLGVGGVAVALALQKPMEDVFGAITLYSQQPVKLGDFCQIGNQTGTVEEIGLRTTRIRTLANTVISLPNSRMAVEAIDNISAREKILFRPMLRLRYDTPPDAMKQVLEGIREMLEKHDMVSPGAMRVRFKEITHDALLIEVFAYVTTTDWLRYLEVAEELNSAIVGIISDAGTSLAPPVLEMHG